MTKAEETARRLAAMMWQRITWRVEVDTLYTSTKYVVTMSYGGGCCRRFWGKSSDEAWRSAAHELRGMVRSRAEMLAAKHVRARIAGNATTAKKIAASIDLLVDALRKKA